MSEERKRGCCKLSGLCWNMAASLMPGKSWWPSKTQRITWRTPLSAPCLEHSRFSTTRPRNTYVAPSLPPPPPPSPSPLEQSKTSERI